MTNVVATRRDTQLELQYCKVEDQNDLQLHFFKSVIERFKQIRPKIIFSITSVAYNGKKYDHKSKLIDVVNGL